MDNRYVDSPLSNEHRKSREPVAFESSSFSPRFSSSNPSFGKDSYFTSNFHHFPHPNHFHAQNQAVPGHTNPAQQSFMGVLGYPAVPYMDSHASLLPSASPYHQYHHQQTHQLNHHYPQQQTPYLAPTGHVEPLAGQLASAQLPFPSLSTTTSNTHTGSTSSTHQMQLTSFNPMFSVPASRWTATPSFIPQMTNSEMLSSRAPALEKPVSINVDTIPLKLRFNSTTWQNRPARIYLDADGLDPETQELSGFASVPKYLVLSAPNHGSPRIIQNNQQRRPTIVYNYSADKSFFELQIWRKLDAYSQEPVLIRDFPQEAHGFVGKPPSITLDRLGCAKCEIFCTINCEKGLKVQDLFVIGILRIGGKLYVSEQTPFPVSSSKKKHVDEYPTSRGSSPYEGKPSPKRVQTEPPPGLSTWLELEAFLVKNFWNGTTLIDHINTILRYQQETDGVSSDICKQEFLSWIQAGSVALGETQFLEKILSPVLGSSWFFSHISDPMVESILDDQCNNFSKNDGVFLIRPSKVNRPFFQLDGRYITEPGQKKSYTAQIKYEIDEKTREINFWVDTKLDNLGSRGPTMAGVVAYVEQRTGWKAYTETKSEPLP